MPNSVKHSFSPFKKHSVISHLPAIFLSLVHLSACLTDMPALLDICSGPSPFRKASSKRGFWAGLIRGPGLKPSQMPKGRNICFSTRSLFEEWETNVKTIVFIHIVKQHSHPHWIFFGTTFLAYNFDFLKKLSTNSCQRANLTPLIT